MKSFMNRCHSHFKILSIILIMLLSIISVSALTLINENVQNWTAHASYGNFTQVIPAGTVTMTACLVQPNAVASGSGSAGRIQCQQTNGIIQFPELVSVGQVEFHFAAGSSGRTVILQKQNGATWEDITTFTGIAATGATFSYDVNISASTVLRLASPSNPIYVHDIIVTDYQSSELPIVSTSAVSNITYNTAVCGGNVENAGTTAILAKGVCWSTTASPDLTGSFTTDGTGIGSYVSNITGLNADTDYYVRAYATNSAGTSYGTDVQFHTGNLGIPSLQATALAFYPGNNSIQTTWIPGNGSKRIVKINNQNNFTLPVNGVDYTANTVYTGNGEQVVYNAATQIVEGEAINAVTVTNLTPNTTYWIRVFDYNGAGATTLYNTNTSTGNPASVNTLNSIVSGYYNGITGTGATLKANLSNLIRTTHTTEFSYDGVWTQLQYTDEDSLNTNNIIEEYTGWSVPKSYNGGGTSQWNREHTWSKSHGDFGESAPAGTDLHHLRPADATVNSSKGNKDFDNGGSAVTDNSPYTGYTGVTGCYTDTDSWEPRAVEKGDIARMIFYMAVRYEGTDTSYNLEVVDTTPSTTGSAPYYGKLSTLLAWHMQDPPDAWEMRRNNRIQERQGNRNPFIDHPEYVNMIWAPTAVNPTVVDSTSFSARWTAGISATSYTLDVSTNSDFSSFLPNYQNLNVNNVTSYIVNNLPTNQTYYYRLRAFFTSGYSMYSNTVAVHITNAPYNLASFTVIEAPQGSAFINWSTLFERNLMGYKVLRSQTNDVDTAVIVSQLISATNTSATQTYSFNDNEVSIGNQYYYWLEVFKIDGSTEFNGPVSLTIQGTANDDETNPTPVASINNIYPNPFRQSVNLQVTLPKSDNIHISIYNLKGQCVRNLYNGTRTAGIHSLSWNSKDNFGNQCKPGIYFLRMESSNQVSQKKLMLY